MSEKPSAEDLTSQQQVLPAYEIIKLDILYSWFSIESEYKNYVKVTSLGKIARTEPLSAMLITLYKTILRSMLKHTKLKGFEGAVKLVDGYVKDRNIPEDKIEEVIDLFSDFLYNIGLTNISFEVKPWQDRFKDSYGVF